ncbi:MAG: FUSC family protein [Flavobacterium sp.]|nr:FUSC family protein [Flavobacterium sp.]
MVEKVRFFAESSNFTNALKVTLASVAPVVAFAMLGHFEVGFTIAIGALLAFPSDISSNLKHKVNGLLAASFILAGSAFLVSIVYPFKYILYPVVAIMIFLLAMISAYGPRATLISFSGLLSVSLVFSNIYAGNELIMHTLLMLGGGLFYTCVSLLFYYLRPNRYAELQIAECIRITGKYLKLRGDLWNIDADRKKIVAKQLELQVELNTIHESIREILFSSKHASGPTGQNRKRLIVFVSLLDILELALATGFEHEKLQEKFKDHPQVLRTYQELAYRLASTLKRISKSIVQRTKYVSKHRLLNELAALQDAINEYEATLGAAKSSEGVYMLTTMLDYAEKQAEKINIIEKAVSLTSFAHDLKGRDKDLDKFLTPQYYPLRTLLENFSFSSATFRHALRLTIAILCGMIIGELLPLQNSYWILLTVVVILRPGYGLTKSRSFERIIGTVIGGMGAFGIVLLIDDVYVITSLAIISMILGYSMSNINYKVGATFVTMYVVFLYSMLTPDVRDVVGYRIIDTVVAAAIAFLANNFLWPSWEFLSIPVYLKKAVASNRTYLKEISKLYNQKGEAPVSYRLARKAAFIDIGNLMASYQRMIQEPKRRQKNLSEAYQLAVSNHTLLSSLASLGTYIQSHDTTKASEAFNVVVKAALKNLDETVEMLDGKSSEDSQQADLDLRFSEMRDLTEQTLAEGRELSLLERQLIRQEAQLIIEQLMWLINLTESIRKGVYTMNHKH